MQLPDLLGNNEAIAFHFIVIHSSSFSLPIAAFMEPDDLLASEKLERLQRRQRRSRRNSGNSPDFEDLKDEDEGTLDIEADPAEPHTSESRLRSRRQAPYVIYPEVLVIVDYDGYRLHGGDNLQVRTTSKGAQHMKLSLAFIQTVGRTIWIAKRLYSPSRVWRFVKVVSAIFESDRRERVYVHTEDKAHIIIGPYAQQKPNRINI